VNAVGLDGVGKKILKLLCETDSIGRENRQRDRELDALAHGFSRA
jgi:hypothetical protein